MSGTTPGSQREARLNATREAFDSVAADYDGPRGNNELIQDMRHEMWRWLDLTFPTPSRLIDLGCGTGLDAVRLAQRGHHVLATDWSPAMIERTRTRAREAGLGEAVDARTVGVQELQRLDDVGPFDGAYSNLGALNCAPELGAVAAQCARLVRPGGALVFTVIGRWCPWELAHYGLRGRFARAAIRYRRGAVPVSMNGRTIWTHYYTPAQFYRPFAPGFERVHVRGLCLFAPPPYLGTVRARWPRTYRALWSADRRLAGWPALRAFGDHFLIVMRRRPA